MADKEKKVAPESKVDKATTEESKAAEKVAKAAKGSKTKKPNFFKRTGKGTKKFFKDFKGECKKIDWPDAQTILKSTAVVLLVVAIVSVFVFALDFGLKEGIEQLKLLASGETSEVVTDGNVTDGDVAEEEHDHDHDHDHEEETDAKTTEAETTEAEVTEAETTEAEESTAEEAE